MSEIYLVARGTEPSRKMTIPAIAVAIAAGELSLDDQYWQEGRTHWEPLRAIPGLSARVAQIGSPRAGTSAPRSKPRQSTRGQQPSPGIGFQPNVAALPSNPWGDTVPQNAGTKPADFWALTSKPRIRLWSAVSYTLASLVFTPLLGSIFIFRNHTQADERIWRGVPLFWIVAWISFIAATLVERVVFRGHHWPWYLAGFGALWVFWFFTCALPHRLFLKAQPTEVTWRSDWGKPLGFGFLGLVLYTIVMLLARR